MSFYQFYQHKVISLFSLNKNRWRQIKFCSDEIPNSDHTAANNDENFFWLIDDYLLSFNLQREAFSKISLHVDASYETLEFSVCDTHLAVHYRKHQSSFVRIWNVKDSETNLTCTIIRDISSFAENVDMDFLCMLQDKLIFIYEEEIVDDE